eukprot:403370032
MDAAVGISETSNFQAQQQIPNEDLNLKPTFDSNNQSYSNSDAANLLNVCYDDYDEYQEQSLASKQTALNDQEILDSVETLQTLNQQDLKERCDQNQIELQDDAKTAVSANHGGSQATEDKDSTLKPNKDASIAQDRSIQIQKECLEEGGNSQNPRIINIKDDKMRGFRSNSQNENGQNSQLSKDIHSRILLLNKPENRQERSNENISNRVVTLNSRLESENLNNYPQEYRRHNYQNHGYNQNQNYNRNYQQRRRVEVEITLKDINKTIIKEEDRTKEAIKIAIINSNDPIIMAAIINLTSFSKGNEDLPIDRSEKYNQENPGNNVYIAGIPRWVNESDLLKTFEKYGKILEVKVIRDHITKNSKGFAYVLYERSSDAQRAIEGLDGVRVYNEWMLKVELAKRALPYEPRHNIQLSNSIISGQDYGSENDRKLQEINIRKQDFLLERGVEIQREEQFIERERKNFHKYQEKERNLNEQRNQDNESNKARKSSQNHETKDNRDSHERYSRSNQDNKIRDTKIERSHTKEIISKESHENLKQNEQASSHKVEKDRSRSKKSLEKKRRSHSKEKQILSRERKHIKSSSRKKNEKIRNDEDQRREQRSRDHSDMRIDEKSRDRHQNRRSRSRDNHQNSYQNMRDRYPNRPNGYYNNNNRQNNHQHYNNNHQQNDYQNNQRNNYHNNNSQAQRGGHYDNQRNGYQNYGRDHQNQQRYQQQQQYRDYKR